MDLKRTLSGKWFTRLVMINWIVCAVLILVIFKNMELIVHGQLYSYGLVFSSDWADPYRIFTWLLFICLGLPTALGGVALASTFFKVEEDPKKEKLVPQRQELPRGGVKLESPKIIKEAAVKAENGNGNGNGSGISCPNCKRVFGKALVMLDFHGGKNRMVSVCPYCNAVLGYTGEECISNESFHVASPDEKIIR
jgi:hypothetical protein